MDAQVGIIRNQAVANGTEDIVELVALLHQAVLYQHCLLYTSIHTFPPCRRGWLRNGKLLAYPPPHLAPGNPAAERLVPGNGRVRQGTLRRHYLSLIHILKPTQSKSEPKAMPTTSTRTANIHSPSCCQPQPARKAPSDVYKRQTAHAPASPRRV